jgi:hypothetical protein
MAKKKSSATETAPSLVAAPSGRKRMAVAAAPRAGNGNADPAPTHDEIAEAAYHRYLRRQGAHGSDFDDWVEAERELRLRSASTSQTH